MCHRRSTQTTFMIVAAIVAVGSTWDGTLRCASADQDIEAYLDVERNIGVAFGLMPEGTDEVSVTLMAPDEWSIVVSDESSKVVDPSGTTIWKRITATSVAHYWRGYGFQTESGQADITNTIINSGASVRFWGELYKSGSGGETPEFLASVADIDIDVDSSQPPRHEADHWPPYAEESTDRGQAEDQSESTETGGLFLPTSLYEGEDFPSTCDDNYKILNVQIRTKYQGGLQRDDPCLTSAGTLAFSISGLGIALYDSQGQRVTGAIDVPLSGVQEQYRILTNDLFTTSAGITATFTWKTNPDSHGLAVASGSRIVASGSRIVARDYVRLVPMEVDLDITGLSETEEDSPGGFVIRRCVPHTAPRKAIVLQASGASGYAILTRSDVKVDVFTAATGGASLAFDGVDNKFDAAALPKTLYVEGVTESTSTSDTTTLTLSCCGISDEVTLTIYYLDVLPQSLDILCKGQAKSYYLTAAIKPSMPPGFDANTEIQWECSAGGTFSGGGQQATGTTVTWNQDNSFVSVVENDVVIKAQCSGNGEWVKRKTTIIDLESLHAYDYIYDLNAASVSSPTPATLYVWETDAGNAEIDFYVSTFPADISATEERIHWKVTGSNANPATGDLTNTRITLTPSGGNRTFTLEVGCDINDNDTLEAGEVSRTVVVKLVRVTQLLVEDNGVPGNNATNPSDTEMYVGEQNACGSAEVRVIMFCDPASDSDAKSRVLWRADGNTAAPSSGAFGGATVPVITLSPTTADNRSFDVGIGFDRDASGSLETSEITHTITVTVVNVTVEAEAARGDAPTPNAALTECMEGRRVTYTATASANFPCGVGNPMSFTFNYQKADGTNWSETDWSTDRVEDNTMVADQVPDGDADHKFTMPIYVTAANDGTEATSNTVSIDVYELWIDYFGHYDSGAGTPPVGKAWKVCVFKWIAYGAIAANPCQSWDWDMPDGVTDAWNPEGGHSKSGHDMYIPNSDKAQASNSWFGDTYGTVSVFCEDGDGNNHTFYSTAMSPSNKAEVFFDPETNVEGGGPSNAMPPAWFVFWQDGAVPDLDTFTYNQDRAIYGRSQMHPYWWDLREVGPLAGPTQGYTDSGTHYPGGLLIAGVQYGGATGIDCCREVVVHETRHNFYAAEIYDGAADTDPSAGIMPDGSTDPIGDIVADSREPGFGASVGNPDTFNLAVLKNGVYAGYGDGEYRVILDAYGQAGVAAKDWSYGGKQW